MSQKSADGQVLSHTDRNASEVHERLRSSPNLLSRLSFEGIQPGLDGDYYQCRVCPSCGSQITAPVNKQEAFDLLSACTSMLARSLSQLGAQ